MLYLLGNYIRDQRIKNGFTREQLAKILGYKKLKKGIKKIEKAEENGKITSGLLSSFLKALNLDPIEIENAVQKDKENFETWLNEPVPKEMIVRLIAAVYIKHKIPSHIKTDDDVLEYAKKYAVKNHFKVCLFLNRKVTYWINKDGNGFKTTTSFENPLNKPYMEVQGNENKFLLSAEN